MQEVIIPVGFDEVGEYYHECEYVEDALAWITENDSPFTNTFVEMGHAVGHGRPGQVIMVGDLLFRVYRFDTYMKYLGRRSGTVVKDGDICRTVLDGRVVNFTSLDAYHDWIEDKEEPPSAVDELFGCLDKIGYPMSDEFPEFLLVEERLAKWLHEKYLEFSIEEGWSVQAGTDGSWDKLPIRNKMVMMKMGRLLHQRDTEYILRR